MFKRRIKKQFKKSSPLDRALRSVIEPLEGRVMLYGDMTTVHALPYDLYFNANNGGVVDKNGIGTGFSAVQPNKNTTATSFPEYNPALISIPQNPDGSYQGALNLTTTGNANNGGPYEGDNSLVNALETTFNASTGGWTVTVRLQGPLSNLAASSEQGGLMFGPDDDNYIKLVAAAQPSPNNQVLQFIDEIKSGSSYIHTVPSANSYTNIGSFANINTLDLRISGDPASNTVVGSYRINNGSYVNLLQQFTYSGATASMFFSPTARTGLIAMAKNNLAPVTVSFNSFLIEPGTPNSQRPSISSITLSNDPANGKAYQDTSIIGSVVLPTSGAGVDVATLTASSVQLTRTSDGAVVAATRNTDGAGGVVIIHPTSALAANTQYTISINAGLRDTNGASFLPFTSNFTTSNRLQNPTPTSIAFQDIDLPTATGQLYTDVKFGPDGKLYASTLTGLIQRWSVNADGTLGASQTITTMQTNNGGGNREVTGFVFDPSATATNLIMWVSNSQYGDYGAADFTGKITQLSGANLQTYQDYVVGIPRSIKDHQVEQPTFGPDGAIYVAVGSNTAMGAPDNAWGLRAEDLLSAAILRIDVGSIKSTRINHSLGALNVQTANLPAGQTAYNPYAAGAAVTLYATGIRNAYSIIWNGNTLYAATNGSAANGNVPATPGGIAQFNNPAIEPDMLYKIVKGGYYGHPDPIRGEYILDGGNPTGAATYTLSAYNNATAVAILGYPVGTQPDPNYRGTIDVLGNDNSADGTMIYHSTGFGGLVNNAIVIAQYSAPQDLAFLTLAANGNSVTQTITGVSGLENLNSPLAVTQFQNGTNQNDPRNGYMYVSEYGASKLELLVPVVPGAKISPSATTLYFTQPQNTQSAAQTITITNTGTSLLAFNAGALSAIGGPNAASFKFITSTLPANLAPGASTTISVAFKPGSTSTVNLQTASFTLASNDPTNSSVTFNLRGLDTPAYGGAGEPSGQYIFNLLQIGNGVANITGTPNIASNFMPYPPGAGDIEQQIKQFVKAGQGPVTIQTLALYTVTNGIRMGYYNSGDPTSKTQLLQLASSSVGTTAGTQTVTPNMVGSGSFDPGAGEFSLYAEFPGFTNADKGTERDAYQEDQLNTWDTTVADQQKMRIYPLLTSAGVVVPNAYVVIPEDYTTADDNDAVFIIRNVAPAPASPSFGFINADENTNSDVLTFARQQTTVHPITTGNPNLKPATTSHDTIPLVIFNSGNTVMHINSITISAPNTGPVVNGSRTSSYTITNMPALPLTIPVGGSVTLTVKFVAEGYLSGGVFSNSIRGQVTGTLLVTTDDSNHPSKSFTLNGFWQIYPETTASDQYDEFPMATTLAGQGYTTNVGTATQLVSSGGANSAVGQEILSPYWNLADPTKVVTVHQLQAYHTAGNTATVSWYLKGSTSNHTILVQTNNDGQTVYPRDTVSGNPPAFGTFGPGNTTAFGFNVDGERSDNALNSIANATNPNDVGHHVRIYPAIDEHGQYIPNTYILIMDYQGENYDYNDNSYLISNIRPSTSVAAPQDVTGTTDVSAGNTVTWLANFESVTGYNVYRSTSQSTGFTLLNSSVIPGTSYIDSTAATNQKYYYRVTAVGTGTPAESYPTEISLTRPGNTVIPDSPSVVASASAPNTITINWSLSNGATSYSILRSTTGPAGAYTSLTSVGSTVSSYSDIGLTTNADYSYEVVATNSAGSSAPSSPATATAIIAPAAPTGLGLSVNSSSQITVNWTAVTGASGYTILRSDGNNSNYLPVNGTTGQASTTYVDSGLTAGVTYFYEVVANNAVGSSAPSASLSASTTQAAPVAPIADSAVANGPSKITVTWEAVANATSYFVQRSSNGTNGWSTVTPAGNVTTLTFQDIGLTASTQYFYQVFAVNSVGTSATASNVVNTTTTIAAPAAPAIPTLTPLTGTSIQINWTSVATAATYTVYRSPDGSTGWTGIYTTPDNATFTYTNIGLTPNTQYFYEIVATNVGGDSLPSPSTSTSTPQVQAIAPGTLTATPVPLTAAVSLSWGASANATGYDIQRSAPDTGSGFSWVTIHSNVGGASTTYTDPGVTLGTTYVYQIIATNSVAPSVPSNVSVATTVPAIPSPLGGSAASFVSVNLNWADVTGETGFSIERAPAGSTNFAVVGTVTQGVLTFVDSNLLPATSYVYRVRAVDAGGFSDYTPTFTATTLGTSMLQDVGGAAFTDSLGNQWVADNPALWTGGTISNGAVAIANTTDDFLYYTRRYGNMTYTLPANNGNYTLKLYFAEPTMTAANKRVFNVLAQGATILNNFDIFKVAGAKTANIQTFNINVTTGQLVVQFVNNIDNAIISAIQLIPNQPNQPATPTGLTATAVDSKNINLSWTNNATNDTGYKIERSLDQSNWTLVPGTAPFSIVAGATLNFTDTGLKANTHYFYRVRATNNGLDSLNSNINSATTIVAAPVGVAAVGDGPVGIDVSWTAVIGATVYTVQRSNDGSTGWTTVGSPTTNAFPDTGLTTGQTYFYRVSATVAAGTTSYSTNASSPTGVAATPPGTPGGQGATANNATQIAVTWSAVAGATSYQIFRNTDGSTNFGPAIATVPDTGLATYTYLDNNASPSTQYYYEILAVNSGGSSPPPASLATTTTPALPAAPSGLGFSNVLTTEIDLSWNPVVGAISYTLQRSPTGAAGSWSSFSPITPSGSVSESFADKTASPSNTYFYQISVTTATGTSLFSAAVNTTTLPVAPSGLAVTAVASTEIDLGWNAVSGATSYLVQRSLTGQPGSWNAGVSVLPSGGASESYADTTTSAVTAYFYQVSVTTTAGTSAPSALVTAITAPAVPTGLTVTNTTSSEIDLSWTAIAGVTNYVLQRSLTGAANSWSNLNTVTPSGNPTETYHDTSLIAGTQYFYRFSATIAAGVSAPTASVNATTSAAVPSAPTAFIISGVQATQVTLSWSESSTAITGFFIQRSTDNATWGNGVTVGNVGTTNITGLSSNTTYYFQIQAINGAVSSGFTGAGPTTTLPPAVPTTVIVDDIGATKVGAWSSGNTTGGFYGSDYLSDGNTGKTTQPVKSVTFTPNLTAGGTYKVYARWTAASSRATNVPIDINHQGTTDTVTVNQQQNNGVWVLLGTYTFDAGTGGSVTIRNTGANGIVIADAVEFVPA